MRDRARNGAPGGGDDPVATREQHGRHDDPGRIQDRRQRIEHEPSVGDEHLAERDRRREHDLRDAVDPHHVDGQLARGGVEAGPDPVGQPGRREEDQDARHGVMTQTRRHSFIVSLLGLQHVVVAINKMDLVGYSRDAFERIKDD